MSKRLCKEKLSSATIGSCKRSRLCVATVAGSFDCMCRRLTTSHPNITNKATRLAVTNLHHCLTRSQKAVYSSPARKPHSNSPHTKELSNRSAIAGGTPSPGAHCSYWAPTAQSPDKIPTGLVERLATKAQVQLTNTAPASHQVFP